MTTFAGSWDAAGKTIHPVTTYAKSGPGSTEQDDAASCRSAVIGEGPAVSGEEVRDAMPAAGSCLRRIGLLENHVS
jgi:hypothetical protein